VNDELITTRVAAALLGVGTTSIKRWADDGTLACVRTAGGHRRFLRGEVLRLFEADEPGVGLIGRKPDDQLAGQLPGMSSSQLDALSVGVIQLSDQGHVKQYNAFEETFAKRRRDDVKGQNFFTEVAPCTNNRMIYGAFRDGIAAGSLDMATEYTFTYKMAPRAVALHLFRDNDTSTNWLIVRPR
jgi:photoactive yellow protein